MQTFAEKLFVRLQRSSGEKMETRMAVITLISRVVGVHRLILLNFYPFLQRYLQPHQRDVTTLLAALIQVRPAPHNLCTTEMLDLQQPSTARLGRAGHGMAWHGMAWHGMAALCHPCSPSDDEGRLKLAHSVPSSRATSCAQCCGTTADAQAALQACHELVPPDAMTAVLRQLVDAFVHDRARPEVMTLGLKTVRELCARMPLIMTTDLLQVTAPSHGCQLELPERQMPAVSTATLHVPLPTCMQGMP